ncbi:GntR family transcriptional regulator [Boseaceae bacterium BT-24-1]|nr:GntR family transcriptional regulator [Boseaceae bacterium BT-24-1]
MASAFTTEAIRVERPNKTLRELTLDKVRDAITSGYFRPGDRLIERDLCAQLGVSRTVVREVLRHLETEGLVTNLANRGPTVAELDTDEARQIYEIRGALEGMAARQCAERGDAGLADRLATALAAIVKAYRDKDMAGVLSRTTDFYELLFNGVGLHVAWDIEKQLTGRINHLRSMTIRTEGRAVDGPARMGSIVEAICKKDGEAAQAAAIAHVESASRIAISLLEAERAARD